MTVKLTNRSGRMMAFNLPHDTYCQAFGTCVCTASGNRLGSRIPSSLTIPSGASMEGLPDATLKAPEVLRAVKRGAIEVHFEPNERMPESELPEDKPRDEEKSDTDNGEVI